MNPLSINYFQDWFYLTFPKSQLKAPENKSEVNLVSKVSGCQENKDRDLPITKRKLSGKYMTDQIVFSFILG